MAFSDSISTSAPPFTTTTAAHLLSPSTYYSYVGTKQLPTNAWWENILIPFYDQNTYNGKTATFPYAQWPASGGSGFTLTYFGDQSGDRDVAAKAITLSGAKDMTFETAETVTTRQVTDYSDLGVNLKYITASGNMTTSFVQGQAFTAATYKTATPKITSENAILLINGVAPGSANLTNISKLKIQTNRYNRSWLVYFSTPISLTLNGLVFTATAPYTGTVQTAVLDADANESTYDTASTCIVTGGVVNSTFSGNTASMTFTFTTSGSGTLLMYALPHHQDLMPGATYTNISLDTLKGTMKALLGSTWTLNETLTTISWRAPNAVPTSAYSDIQAALAIEKNSTYDGVGGGYGWSPYYGGKYVAKMARMILIAEEVGDTASATSIATTLKATINSYIMATPTGTEGSSGSGYINALIYQAGSSWKGIATQNGLADMGADFGSGRFNDHHFHYGYWIFAAAVLARNDSTWLANIKPYIESLIRDIANPSYNDTYFPKFRHKDWFNGHSYADGLVGMDVGPGQESTSEAINAWYGIYLWGTVTSNTDMLNMGRLLLASEVRSAKRYWHIYDNSDIYPTPYNANGTAVIVRTHKTAVETYFGSLPQYFYGIQSIPFTPISELYLDQPWVSRSYAYASSGLPAPVTSNPQDTSWDSIIWSLHAVIDPATAYQEALSLTLEQIPDYTTFVEYGRQIDNGHSKANALYWASTRTVATSACASATITNINVTPSSTALSGAAIAITATVIPAAATGVITFMDGVSTLGTATLSAGTATFTSKTLASGSHSFSASFASANTAVYTSSSSAITPFIITLSSTVTTTSTSNANGVPFRPMGIGQPSQMIRTVVADVNYTIQSTDVIVGVTTLTASRTITLPVASSDATGTQFIIKDESGSCSPSTQIVISGTIDGTVNKVLTSAYAKAIVYSSGSLWYSVLA